MKRSSLWLSLMVFVSTFTDVLPPAAAQLSDPAPLVSQPDLTEPRRRHMAVTLNYCRAALHRIRRAPSKRILLEEQQRILNNLDLNRIDDPEVISLYRSILDEIGLVEISDRERIVIEENYARGVQRKLGTDLFVIGAQAATGQVGNVIQSGANSWWDYRSIQFKRDADMWQVEKTQFTTLLARSSTFLDSFWKLSRKNDIPDRWLLRDQDLDILADTLAEQDPERRLRMLKRQERFMECYPPYWYYLARTQQQLGRSDDALLTFKRLMDLGAGHFRQDDMLASSMANVSLIQEGRGDPEAPQTAARAFTYSSRNWEANLVCAWVLGRHQKFRDAEDLIFCNLDDRLEVEQSSVALASLYFHSGDKPRLTRLLADETTVRRIPIPALLLCAKLLGPDKLPEPAETYLASTLTAVPRRSGRSHAISISAASAWKLNDAEIRINDGDRWFEYAGHRSLEDGIEVSFIPSLSSRTDGEPGRTLEMTLKYPETPVIQVVLIEDQPDETAAPARSVQPRFPLFRPGSGGVIPARESQRVYRIEEIEVDGLRLSLRQPSDSAGEIRVLKPVRPDDSGTTRG